MASSPEASPVVVKATTVPLMFMRSAAAVLPALKAPARPCTLQSPPLIAPLICTLVSVKPLATPDSSTLALNSPATTRLLSPAASMRLAPAALLVQLATLTLTLLPRAISSESVTAPALRLKSAVPGMFSAAPLTLPTFRLATLPAKLAAPLRSALARLSAPTALLVVMPVRANWPPAGFTMDTPLADVVPLSCSKKPAPCATS